jgi:prepilin-type N-terminal cleavage/methylation domain-containing protein
VAMKNRRGFTLVELLVAILLIDVGLLGLVAGSAIVVRRQNEIRLRGIATGAASNRVQQLVASGCHSAQGSAVVAPGINERWSVSGSGSATRDIDDSVSYVLAGVNRSVVLRTRVVC